jgi:predicted RNase H-like HicB family nuclease
MSMIELSYSLIIEATEEPDFFGFYSADLEGFTGIGYSIEDCLYQAKWGMQEFVEIMIEKGMPVPPRDDNPRLTIMDSGRLERPTRADPTNPPLEKSARN